VVTPEPRPGPTQRVRPGDPHTVSLSQVPQAAGGGVAVHPGAAAIQQDRPAATGRDRAVDRPPDRWRQRDQDDLGPFAAHPQHPVAVFFAEIGDVCSGSFEDPQPEQPEHGDKREVARVRGLPGRGEQCLELQVGESQRR